MGAGSVLGVAELGLPVLDAQAAVAALETSLGVGLWDRDNIGTGTLTPVGEQAATFIVVPVGRRWLVGEIAALHPLEVVLAGTRDATLELPAHPYVLHGRP